MNSTIKCITGNDVVVTVKRLTKRYFSIVVTDRSGIVAVNNTITNKKKAIARAYEMHDWTINRHSLNQNKT